jgi:regulatory protein
VAGHARSAQDRREAADERRARRASITDPDVVMEAAAAFLAVRPRSVGETRGRLIRLGYPAGLCGQVVERLVELGDLDDADFARAWVESRDRAKPRGESALRRELQLKGVPDAIISDVLGSRAQAAAGQTSAGQLRDADHAAAQRLLDRRASSLRRDPDPRRQRQRAYALLARNGFAPDVCQAVASTFVDQEADDGR